MCDFIFSFSHLEIKNILDLKNELRTESYDSIHFLTRKNFNSFFKFEDRAKYLNLKKILTGKYLLIRSKDEDNLNIVKNKLFKLITHVENLNINLSFFCLISNNQYYFKDFFLLSHKYSNQILYKTFIAKQKIYYLNILLFQYLNFFLYTFRIINLKRIHVNYTSMYN